MFQILFLTEKIRFSLGCFGGLSDSNGAATVLQGVTTKVARINEKGDNERHRSKLRVEFVEHVCKII